MVKEFGNERFNTFRKSSPAIRCSPHEKFGAAAAVGFMDADLMLLWELEWGFLA